MRVPWFRNISPSVVIPRCCHALIVLSIFVSLFFKSSVFQSQLFRISPELILGVSYCLLVSLSLFFYFSACFADPGFIQRHIKYDDSDSDNEQLDSTYFVEENVSENLLNEEAKQEIEDSKEIKLRKCGYCGITQPLRAHHCSDCDRCVRKFDHHCPWLGTCVGERNHHYFWAFITSQLIVIIWTAVLVWQSLQFQSSWAAYFRVNGVLIFDLVVLVIGGMPVTCLFCIHTYIAATNQTTWELMSRERITYLKNQPEDSNPFHLGYLKNVYFFLCKQGHRQWEKLYRGRLRRGVSTGV